jgi:hypothetical protein
MNLLAGSLLIMKARATIDPSGQKDSLFGELILTLAKEGPGSAGAPIRIAALRLNIWIDRSSRCYTLQISRKAK